MFFCGDDGKSFEFLTWPKGKIGGGFIYHSSDKNLEVPLDEEADKVDNYAGFLNVFFAISALKFQVGIFSGSVDLRTTSGLQNGADEASDDLYYGSNRNPETGIPNILRSKNITALGASVHLTLGNPTKDDFFLNTFTGFPGSIASEFSLGNGLGTKLTLGLSRYFSINAFFGTQKGSLAMNASTGNKSFFDAQGISKDDLVLETGIAGTIPAHEKVAIKPELIYVQELKKGDSVGKDTANCLGGKLAFEITPNDDWSILFGGYFGGKEKLATLLGGGNLEINYKKFKFAAGYEGSSTTGEKIEVLDNATGEIIELQEKTGYHSIAPAVSYTFEKEDPNIKKDKDFLELSASYQFMKRSFSPTGEDEKEILNHTFMISGLIFF